MIRTSRVCPLPVARRDHRPAQRPRPGAAVLGLTLLLLALGACGPTASEASKRYARPWNQGLTGLFDDQNDVCSPWLGSQEIWAVNERHQLAQRADQADIIAVGLVRALIRTNAYGESKQASLQIDLEDLLRGTPLDLPDGSRRVVLPISAEQEARITNRIIGRQAVLFLRWLPGTSPPYHWHLTCATPGVAEQTKTFLKARQKGLKPQ